LSAVVSLLRYVEFLLLFCCVESRISLEPSVKAVCLMCILLLVERLLMIIVDYCCQNQVILC